MDWYSSLASVVRSAAGAISYLNKLTSRLRCAGWIESCEVSSVEKNWTEWLEFDYWTVPCLSRWSGLLHVLVTSSVEVECVTDGLDSHHWHHATTATSAPLLASSTNWPMMHKYTFTFYLHNAIEMYILWREGRGCDELETFDMNCLSFGLNFFDWKWPGYGYQLVTCLLFYLRYYMLRCV